MYTWKNSNFLKNDFELSKHSTLYTCLIRKRQCYSSWRSLENVTKNVLCWYIIFSLKIGKQQIQVEAFCELLVSAYIQILWKKFKCHQWTSGEFQQKERLTPIPGQETRSPHHTQTNFVTNYQSSHFSAKGSLIFPKRSLTLL